MSFLDLLCSALGAVVLLMVLSKTDMDRRVSSAEAVRDAVRQKNEQLKAQASAIDSRASTMRKYAQELRRSPQVSLSDSSRQQVMPHTVTRNLVVILDTSGSMDYYHPPYVPEPAGLPGWKKQRGLKWTQAIDTLEKMLLQMQSLQRFVVLGLTADDRNGEPLVPPPDGVWFRRDTRAQLDDVIIDVCSQLRSRRPRGGARHLDAVNAGLSYIRRAGDDAADTIILITDGLPNHGPDSPSPTTSDAMVSSAVRARHARTVTRRLESFFLQRKRSQLNHEIRLHAICLHWPDDPDLTYYAIRWAAPSGGTMLYLPPRKPEGP